MKKNIFLICLLIAFLLGGGLFIFRFTIRDSEDGFISPLGQVSLKQQVPRPLERLSFQNLRNREYQGSEIRLEKVIKEEEKFASWLFSFQSDGKKVTGMLNIPTKRNSKSEARPVVVMLRGYADDEIYFTGLGTRKAARVFAENGFITLAPDFLGFGGSDSSSEDILEARFERPVTVLNLLASIKNLPQADPNKIFLWGHSNGGQIALSVLEISQRPIPSTLWAPVTKGFPESVLQYMHELDDQGLKVKRAIDEFLKIYNPKNYSIDNYFQDIDAPIQVHQGMADEYIKTEWTDRFVLRLKSLGKSVIYYKYPRSDHNLKQDWDMVVARDLGFFKKMMTK